MKLTPFAELSGCTEGFIIDEPVLLRCAVIQLMMCRDHAGVHHFAVTGEGKTLWCSPTGVKCLESIGLYLIGAGVNG